MDKKTRNTILVIGLLVVGTGIIIFDQGLKGLLTGQFIMLVIGAAVAVMATLLAPENKAQPASRQPQLRVPTSNELSSAIDLLQQTTSRPYLKLEAKERSTGVFDSKLGGRPYLPPGFAYPTDLSPQSAGLPLRLLCQLNFSRLPKLPGFPQDGILQFYLTSDLGPEVYGLDFDHPDRQESWRIVYHQEVITDASALQASPDIEQAAAEAGVDYRNSFPFDIDQEYALEAELAEMPINPHDYGWAEFMEMTFEGSKIGEQLKEKYAEDEIEMALSEALPALGHRVGGYPTFTQDDPRHRAYRDHSVLLLQIDSEDDIVWGDYGVANFFITPEALARCDFSSVLYNWDCL